MQNAKCYSKNKNESKWEETMQKPINWKKVYQLPFKSTVDVTLRNFQYKFLHRIIPTNKFLYKCKLSNTNLCDFCSSSVENIDHIFWECTIIQNILSELHMWLNSNGIIFNLSKEILFFGELNVNPYKDIINFILILIKYYILKTKYQKYTPSFHIFKKILCSRIQIEEQIALSKDNLEKHKKKWDILSNISF